MEELLKIDDLSKSFVMHRAGRHILGCQHISLSLTPGEFVGITGQQRIGQIDHPALHLPHQFAGVGRHLVQLGIVWSA